MATKYYLYARKSTEDDDHQIMSIEAQLFELREYARREKLEIVKEFTESKSAKKPGREIFNELMTRIEKDEGAGILAWHPDRLARNSVDGGKIIYLVDTKKIISLKFPTFWFEPTPQGLFMLQVAFGQSKYYTDNLSENINRGFRQKIRRGEWPTKAPLGYQNNYKTRTIEPHPVHSKIVAKAFEEYAKGIYTYESLAELMFELGVETKNHTPLGKASIWRMLSNRAYLGFTKHKGEYFEGSFPAILNPVIFESAQQILQGNAKPRKQKQEYNFPLRGLLTCGECGCAITGQYTPKKKGRGLFLYYRCTKKRGPCSQGFLQEKYLVAQLRAWLQKIAIDDEWTYLMLEQVDRWEKDQNSSLELDSQNLKDKVSAIQDKLDRLVSAYLDQEIPKEIYLAKKEELLKQKLALSQGLDNFKRKRGKVWLQPLRQWILDLKQATFVARSDNLLEIKSMIQKVGSNPQLFNKTVKIRFRPPFCFAPDLLTQLQTAPLSRLKKTGPNFKKNFASSFWWRCRELNPGPKLVYLFIVHKISQLNTLTAGADQIPLKLIYEILVLPVQIEWAKSSP